MSRQRLETSTWKGLAERWRKFVHSENEGPPHGHSSNAVWELVDDGNTICGSKDLKNSQLEFDRCLLMKTDNFVDDMFNETSEHAYIWLRAKFKFKFYL